jgi:hypothetical protein
MGKVSKLANLGVVLVSLLILLSIVFTIKTCSKKPVPNPAVDRLHDINDSLYDVIEQNNKIANDLYEKLDSITILSDTIIQRQEITNKYYKNEVYNILSSTDSDANTQFRSTLKKSDSLLKSGFYTKTYNLRSSVNEPQFH